MFFAGGEMFGMPFDAGNLSTEREIQIGIQIDRCPDFSYFQAAVCFFTGFMLRGEMPRVIRGRRCLVSGWIDYPSRGNSNRPFCFEQERMPDLCGYGGRRQ